MRDKELYAKILGIESPWRVTEVDLSLEDGEILVHLDNGDKRPPCPECGKLCSGYDTRSRRWRHLDTCQYRTVLVAQVPRIECPVHGVLQIRVPWSEPGSRFTALFESLVIDWLQEASISAVTRLVGLDWGEVDRIMTRAVARGLTRRERRLPQRIGVDETSFQKRHEYVTVVCDQQEDVVVHVADGRGRDSLDDFYKTFDKEQRQAVESVAMDMWAAYIGSTVQYIPGAETKIAFDKFHVAQHLSNAVDKIRRQENKFLVEQGDERLKGSKYLWLQNPDNMSDERWSSFESLRQASLKTARAWAIKELAMSLWQYTYRGSARKAWNKWYSWAIRSRLEPIQEVAKMVQRHLEGILTAIVRGVTNARSEGINAKIQWIKYTARGFRNRERFRNAIYFHIGGLQLHPEGVTR